jgi:hypothetical protein
MVTLVEKYVPTQPPAEPERLGDFLRDELERIAVHMAGRDEVVTGRATFPAATTVAVTFAREQPDTRYQILLGPSSSNTHWWSARAVTGFTLHSSVSTSENIDWAIFRDRDND